ASWIVFHRALDLFLAQDDFESLARTVGLLPRLTGPWRLVGKQLLFDALHALAGLNPRPYHLAALLAHAGCAALLFVLLGRRISRPASFAGAAFFAVHPLLYTGCPPRPIPSRCCSRSPAFSRSRRAAGCGSRGSPRSRSRSCPRSAPRCFRSRGWCCRRGGTARPSRWKRDAAASSRG